MHGLVLSGGGAKGSWQAGAIKAVSEKYIEGFDIVSGTSVGALNGALIAHYDPNEFRAASSVLEKIWNDKLDVWNLRFPPYLAGLWSESLGKSDGLNRLVDQFFNLENLRRSKTHLNVTAVNIRRGSVRRFTQHDVEIRKGILASASFPVFFPLVEIAGELYTDGGVRDIAPLDAAIEYGCDELVVVTTSNPDAIHKMVRPRNAAQVLLNTLEIMALEVLHNDVARCRAEHGIKVTLLHPEKPLGDPLDFSRKTMRQQFADGYTEAKNKLAKG